LGAKTSYLCDKDLKTDRGEIDSFKDSGLDRRRGGGGAGGIYKKQWNRIGGLHWKVCVERRR